MKEDDNEPALRWLLVLTVIIVFCLGPVASAQTPIVESKQPVKVTKKKLNTISGWFKPNTKRLPYKWYYKTWINKCAYCGHHLHMNPKKVPERELTCSRCGADYDGVQGIVKNGKKNKRLRRA